MANQIPVLSGTPVVWADTTDYAGDGGARTHQIDLTSLADGAARQGAKAQKPLWMFIGRLHHTPLLEH